MSTDHGPTRRASSASAIGDRGIPQYEIRVSGHLEPRWAAWFDGLDLRTEDDGTTVICGSVVDQAALHGLLQRLRDIGVPLLSLTQPSPAPTDVPAVPTHPTPQNPSGATS